MKEVITSKIFCSGDDFMIAVGGGAEYFEVEDRIRRDIRAELRRSMSEVIQGEGLMWNELLVLVMSGE